MRDPRATRYVYFLRPPRPEFAATMTDEEEAAMGAHYLYLVDLLERGKLVLAGPCLDPGGPGIAILDVTEEAEARSIMSNDPAVRAGVVGADLHPMRVSVMAGRDDPAMLRDD